MRCGPLMPRSGQRTVTVRGSPPWRLKRPTAFEPSSMSLAQTSSGPCFHTRRPGFAERVLVHVDHLVVRERSESVKGSRRVTSPLKMSGAATSDQSDTWVYCSLGVSGEGAVAPFQFER